MEYKIIVEFKDIEKLQSNKIVDQEVSNEKKSNISIPETNSMETKKSGITPKGVFGVASTTIGIAMYVGNVIATGETNKHALSGEFIKAKNSAHTANMLNQGVGAGMSIAAGAIIGGPVGVAVAVGYQALSFAKKAIEHVQKLEMFVIQQAQDNRRSVYEQDRLGRDTRFIR